MGTGSPSDCATKKQHAAFAFALVLLAAACVSDPPRFDGEALAFIAGSRWADDCDAPTYTEDWIPLSGLPAHVARSGTLLWGGGGAVTNVARDGARLSYWTIGGETGVYRVIDDNHIRLWSQRGDPSELTVMVEAGEGADGSGPTPVLTRCPLPPDARPSGP